MTTKRMTDEEYEKLHNTLSEEESHWISYLTLWAPVEWMSDAVRTRTFKKNAEQPTVVFGENAVLILKAELDDRVAFDATGVDANTTGSVWDAGFENDLM